MFPMTSCSSFGEVAALTQALQVQLLKSGDPTERVWAAWSHPDDRVRATACDFLVRTSNEEEEASTLAFSSRRLVAESSLGERKNEGRTRRSAVRRAAWKSVRHHLKRNLIT